MESGLLFELIVVLSFTAICLIVTRQLHLGSTLAFLLTGFLLGPSVFDFISTKESESFGYSSLGVVLMLFVIGLELEPKKLWALRAWIGRIGFSQVIVTGLLLGLVAILLGFNWREAIVIGLGMAMSSTAMVLPLLKELYLNRTPAYEKTVPVLLSQDFAAIPLLLLIGFMGAMQSTGEVHFGWMPIILAVVTVMATVLFGLYALNPLLGWLYGLKVPALMPASVGLLIFSTAWLMEDVGLTTSMGAFLSGMMLAGSPYRLTLNAVVKPFKAWLLGLFFIGIGIQINLSSLLAHPLGILSTVVAIVVIKFIILFILARMGKLPTQQSLYFAAALSQAGEFALIVIQSAVTANIVPAVEVSELYTIVVLSMFTTPLLLICMIRLFRPKRSEFELPDKISESGLIVLGGLGTLGRQLLIQLSITNKPIIGVDTDLSIINQIRKIQKNVYLGDLSKPELYTNLNLKQAQAVIISYRDKELSCKAVGQIHELYPKTYILAIANGRIHAHNLTKLGASHVIRENFATSQDLFIDLLKHTGFEQDKIDELISLTQEFDKKINNMVENEALGIDNEDFYRVFSSLQQHLRNRFSELSSSE